jgi:carbon-monoxide dehydrogenase medium subunit
VITSPFTYYKPASIKEATATLAKFGDTARVIAGGHSLIPVMKQRLTDIDHLVDLAGIKELKGISIDKDKVTIGAMTTQHELINHKALSKKVPIIQEAALQIADPQVRYIGTIGGNVANGDPANDMPGLAQVLDAQYHLSGKKGSRKVAARDFYEAAYFTVRKDDEILTAISFDIPKGGYAYEKQKRKIGDYATAAAGVILSVSKSVCTSASIALTNLGDTPLYCEESVSILKGNKIDDETIDKAVKAAVDITDPAEDQRGPVEFKKYAAGVIVKRAITNALARA